MENKSHGAVGVAPARGGGMDNVVPETPSWFPYFRYGQLAGCFIVFLCSIIAVAKANSVGGGYLVSWGPGFSIFTCVWTFVYLAAVLLVPKYAANLYYKWFCLATECLCVFWWLISFAGLALWATAFSVADSVGNSLGGVVDNYTSTIHGATSAAAVFGAFTWVSFIISLVFYSIGCHRAKVAKRSGVHQHGLEAGSTSMGPIGGQPQYSQGPEGYQQQQGGYQQQPYSNAPTPAPGQPYQ